MGACCIGKESKNDRIEEEICTKHTRAQILTEYTKNSVPKIEMEVEKSNLNGTLTELIHKYNNSCENVNMKKFSMEQLWNVCKFYLDDFTNSEYIICDLRDKANKKENFLKKFKIINYSIDEMKMLNEISVTKFKRYLDFKHLILILNEDLIDSVEQIIKYMSSKKINPKFYLFDNNLQFVDLSQNNKFLLEFLDLKNFHYYPYIMLSLKFFPHLKSENFIFFDYVNKESVFNQNFLADPKNKDTNILRFFNYFNTASLFQINIKNEENRSEKSINEFKIKNNLNNTTAICKTINMFGLNTLKDIEYKKSSIMNFIEILKLDVISNKSVFIHVDEAIDNEVLIYFIVLFVWKITDIPPKKIKNYISENFIFIKDIKNYLQNNFNRIEDFLQEKFELVEEDFYESKRENTDIEDLKLVKDKFDYHLKRLKNEVDEEEFKQIANTLEKILLNVIENPNNDKFYKIKMESLHFKKYLSVNPHSLGILQNFGFLKKIIEDSEYYCLNQDVNLAYIKGLFFDFSNILKKYS